MNTDFYCKDCNKTLSPMNTKEVESGEHNGYIYVHDESVLHDKVVDEQPIGFKCSPHRGSWKFFEKKTCRFCLPVFTEEEKNNLNQANVNSN